VKLQVIQTEVKVLYSDNGIYFLFHCSDGLLKASLPADFMDLWKEDEWKFLSGRMKSNLFISNMNYLPDRELVLLVPNFGGANIGWRPWHYEGDRLVRMRP